MDHFMNQQQSEDFFDIIEEMAKISVQINRLVDDDDKKWKVKMHFAMIRDLVWQAEALLKGGTGVNDDF